MIRHVLPRSLLATSLALAVTIAAVPSLARAAGGEADRSRPGIRAAALRAAASMSAATVPAPVPAVRSSAQADLESPGFFRTPAGIVTLAVVAVGAGYAIYSASHDRVRSPAR